MLHVWKTYVSTVNTITLKKNFDLDIQNKRRGCTILKKRKKKKKKERLHVWATLPSVFLDLFKWTKVLEHLQLWRLHNFIYLLFTYFFQIYLLTKFLFYFILFKYYFFIHSFFFLNFINFFNLFLFILNNYIF